MSIIRRQSTNLCREFLILRQRSCANPHTLVHLMAALFLTTNNHNNKRRIRALDAHFYGGYSRRTTILDDPGQYLRARARGNVNLELSRSGKRNTILDDSAQYLRAREAE